MCVSINEDQFRPDSGISHDLNSSMDSGLNLTCSSVEQLSAIIVGTVLKHVFADFSGQEMGKDELIPEIRDLFPSDNFCHVSMDMLDKITVETEDSHIEEKTDSKKEKLSNDRRDADSVLDSEEDLNDSDQIYGKDHTKTFHLDNRKGIHQFKKFLKNSAGEKNWKFWLEIDKSRFLKDSDETQM